MRRTYSLLLLAPLGFLTVDTAFAAKAANAPADEALRRHLAGGPGGRPGCPRPSSVTRVTTTGGPTCRWRPSTGARRRTTRACSRWPRSTATNSTRPTSSTTTCSSARSRRASRNTSSSPGCSPPRTFDGPQLLAEVAEFAPFNTVKDYDNWIARLNTTGIYIDQWILLLTQGTDREAHAAARHHQQGARTAQGPAHRRPRGQPVLRAVQEDAGQHSRRRAGAPHRRRQGRGAGRGDPGLPALRQVLPRGLSTRLARHGGHLRHPGRRAVLPQPHHATTPPSTTWMRRASTTSASRR